MAGRKLILEIVADAEQYYRTLRKSAEATKVFATETKELGASAQVAAQAQVAAAVKGTAALKEQAAALRTVAASAKAGSAEQVAATRLAERAEERLAASLGTVAREARSSARSTAEFDRSLGHAMRGVASGSGIMHGFSRSLAFASGGFLAFEGVSTFIRDSVDAAREAIVSQRALAAQMKTSGQSFAANRDEIERVANSYGRFGFQNDEVVASITILDRATGRLGRALALQGIAADLARARHFGLTQAALILGKVFSGQTTALRRAVPGLDSHAKGLALIAAAQQKLAGQAEANTTAAERFGAELHDTEEIVGTALLPTLNRGLEAFSRWLEQMNRTGQLQRNVTAITGALSDAFNVLRGVMRVLNSVTGGTKNTIEDLALAFAAFKTAELVARFATITSSIAGIGGAATTATGEVGGLSRGLGGLAALGPISIPITLAIGYEVQQGLEGAKGRSKLVKDLSVAGQLAGFFSGALPGLKPISDLIKRGIGATGGGGGGPTAPFPSGPIPFLQTLMGERAADRRAAALVPIIPPGGVPPPATAANRAAVQRQIEQGNQWFDTAIQRLITRAGALPNDQQIARLQQIKQQILDRLAKTRDATRRANLGDVIFNIDQTVAGINEQMAAAEAKTVPKLGDLPDPKKASADRFQKLIDALSLNVDMAGATKTFTDDLRALRRWQAALEERIKVEGRTVDLVRQLFDVRQRTAAVLGEQAQARRESTQARQYLRLGLTATGEERAPAIAALRRQAEAYEKAIKGTRFDTAGRRRFLQGFFDNLKEGIHLGRQLRIQMHDMLQGFADELKNNPLTKTVHYRRVSAQELLERAGLGGLPVAERRRLQYAIAQLGPSGTAPPHQTRQFAGGVITVLGDVHLHGVQDTKGLEGALFRRGRQRPKVRRGA